MPESSIGSTLAWQYQPRHVGPAGPCSVDIVSKGAARVLVAVWLQLLCCSGWQTSTEQSWLERYAGCRIMQDECNIADAVGIMGRPALQNRLPWSSPCVNSSGVCL